MGADHVMPTAQAIGASVRSHREEAGMSQAALGRKIGLTQSAVAAIEKGERNLRWAEGIQLRELVGFDSERSVDPDAAIKYRYRSLLVEQILRLQAELEAVV